MFIGHYAIGFAAKRAAPRTSLGLLIGATVLLDLLWPVFLLPGWEHVRIAPGNTAFTPLDFVDYPISHSLAASVGWALLAAGAYWTATRYRPGAIWIAIGVVSHWVLDFITHRPDLPLWPRGPRVGLGLWDSAPATMALESVMFAAGLWLYLRITRPRDAVGRWALLGFVVFMVAIYSWNAQGLLRASFAARGSASGLAEAGSFLVIGAGAVAASPPGSRRTASGGPRSRRRQWSSRGRAAFSSASSLEEVRPRCSRSR